MTKALALAAAMVLACWSAPARAECEDLPSPILADNFRITAGELMTLSDLALGVYMMGYSQGVLISVLAGSDTVCVDRLAKCTNGRTPGELVDRLRRYVADEPARANQFASRVTFDAIFGACFTALPA
jgi:hypothetical protein